MAQLSSEEALNQILNILDTNIAIANEKKEKTPEAKADDTIISLLQGIVEKAKDNAAATVGDLLEKLSKGLTSMKDIDNEAIEHVATSIGNINKVLNNLKIEDSTTDNIDKFLNTIDKLAEINAEGSKKIVDFINNISFSDPKATAKNIGIVVGAVNVLNKVVAIDMKKLTKNINSLDDSDAEKLGNFLGKFIKTLLKNLPDETEIKNTLKPIGDLMGGLSTIISSNIFSMKISLNPIKGYLLGRLIGLFVKQILKAVQGMKIDESMKYLGSLLDPIARFADPKNEFSVWRLRRALSSGNAKAIGNFFKTIVNQLPDKKESVEALKVIATILDPLYKLSAETSIWSIFKLRRMLSKKNAESIASFFSTIINEIPDNKKIKDSMEGVNLVLRTLLMVSFRDIIAFNLMIKSLSPKNAEKLNTFIKALVEGDWDPKKLDAVNAFLKEWRKILYTIVGSIVVVVLLVTFAPMEAVAAGIAILYFSVRFFKNTILDIINGIKKSDVKEAAEIIRAIGTSVALIMALVAFVAIITKFVGLVAVAAGLAVIWFTLNGIKKLIIELNDKDIKEGTTKALKALWGIGVLILALSAAMFILTATVAKNGIGDVIVAFLIIAAFVAGSIYVIKTLAKLDGDKLDKAANALLKISLVYAIIAIVTATLLRPIGKHLGDVLKGGVVVVAIIALGIYAVKKIMQMDEKETKEACKTLITLAGIFAIVSLITRYVLIPIGKKAEDAFQGAAIIVGIMAALILGVWVLGKVKTETLMKAVTATVILALIYIGIALVTKMVLIPIGEQASEAALGAVITVLLTAALIGGVWLLSKMDGKKALWALLSMACLTLIYLGIALIVKGILIPIGSQASEAILGAGVTLLVTAALMLGVWLLSKMDGKIALWGILATAALALVYLGISLIVKELLIPIGKLTKQAALGAGVTLLVITALILGVWILSKVNGKKALWALLATAAIALILLGVSLIVKELLIPIGKQWEPALIGAATVLGLLVIMGLIMFVVGKFLDKYMATVIEGAVFMLAVAVLMALVGLAVWAFAYEAKRVDDLNEGGAVFLGAATIIGLLVIMGLVMTAVGALVEFLPLTAIGGAAMVAIGVLMDLIGLTVWPFAAMCKKIDDLNEGGKVFTGCATVIGLLAIMGTVMTAAGALAPLIPVIALGGAALTAIGGIMVVLAATMNAFIGVVASVLKYSADDIENAGEIMCKTFEVLFDVISAAAPNPILMVEAAAAAAFAVPCAAVFAMLSLVCSLMLDIVDKFTPDMANAFSLVVIGDGSSDTNSVLGSITAIVDAFSKMDGAYMAMVISQVLRPIIDTISDYIDVILKVATMNYVSGYDDNGKPIYKHLPASAFSDAASAVTTSFQEFLQSLNDGFKDLTILGTASMAIISKLMKPVIDLVGQFIDVILKVATGTYIIGYDDNGNPEYEHLKASDFTAAAQAVTTLFKAFLQSLSEGFKSLFSLGGLVMLAIGDSMKPVMDTVSSFVDTVIKVATMQIVTGYDKDGHPEYEQVDMDRFLTAGVYVAEVFKIFMQNLGNAFKDIKFDTMWAIEMMGDSIAPVMEGVSSFVDSILKLATGQYTDYYMLDKDGNYTVPHFKKVTEAEYITAALTISTMFASFIDELTNSFDKHGGFWGNRTEDALEAVAESIGPVMEGVGSFVEAIINVATGTYVDHMEKDKDGKWVPIYKHMTSKDFAKAAVNIQHYFITFIDALIKKMTEPGFIEKTENASDAITGSIAPIMEALKNFSEALKPFMELKTGDQNNPKASDYICFLPGKIKLIATDIANAITSFIGIIADDLKKNEEKYDDIEGTASTVNSTMQIIKKITDNLSKVIKAMTDENGAVIQTGNDIATKITTILSTFSTYFSQNASTFNGTKDTADTAKEMMASINGIASIYKKIINTITSADNENVSATKAIEGFNNNLLKIANNLIDVSKKGESINFLMIREMTSTYLRIANMLTSMSQYMANNPDMETGITLFVTNVKKLTAPSFNKQMSSSAGNIKLYTARLDDFTQLIVVTTGKVKIFTTTMESARRALVSLDAEIINKEKRRNDALQHFADKINGIATAVDNMRSAFEALDENTILNKFESIRQLLELVTGTSSTDTSTDKKGTTAQKQNTGTTQRQGAGTQRQGAGAQSQAGTNRTTNNYSGMPSSGRVIFEFKNTTLQGFFRAG